ncbi:Ig-like domain-containing protein [Mycolicibacterium phlei]
MGYSSHVGRVGALAVALGVGFAVVTPAGIAWADTDHSATTSSTESGTPASQESPDAPATDTQTTDGAEDGGDSAPPEAPDPTGAASSSPNSPSAQTVEVAPGVTVSNSGGAVSREDDLDLEEFDLEEFEESEAVAPAVDTGSDTRDAGDATSPAEPPATHTSAQTVRTTAEDDDPAETIRRVEDTPEIAPAVLGVAPAPIPAVPPAAKPVTVVDALVKAVVTPLVSRILAAFPGDPASSPLGWLLLGAARREVGVEAAATTTVAARTAPQAMLAAAAAAGGATVDVTLGTPLPATGAVIGRIVADGFAGSTLTYAVTTPPAAGMLVFDAKTASFTYTPTTAQRLAPGTSVAMTITVSDGTTSVPTVVNLPVAAHPVSKTGAISGAGDGNSIAVAGNLTYVTDKAAGTVTVIDTTTDTVVRTYNVGATPDGVAVKHDGTRLYVSSSEGNTVKVIDTKNGKVVKTIKVTAPNAIAVNAKASTLYAVTGDGTLKKISLSSFSTSTVKLPTGWRPTDLAVTPDTKQIYVVGDTGSGYGLAVIASSAKSPTPVLDLPGAPTGLVVSPDSRRLYVATADGRITIVDTATNGVVANRTVAGTPASIAVSRDGSTLLVTDSAGVVSALDAVTGAVLGTVTTGLSAPQAVTTPDGTKLYLSGAGGVTVVSLPPINSLPEERDPVLGAPSSKKGAVTGRVVAADPDGDALKYTLASGPSRGKVTVKADGTFTYTPTSAARHAASSTADGAVTTDSFTVAVADGRGGTIHATVTVDLSATNKVPTAKVTVGKPNSKTGVVTGKVAGKDGDKDKLTYTVTGDPARGTVTLSSNGSFTYTPSAEARHAAAKAGAPSSAKTDTFTVTVDDGHGGVVVKTVSVSVKPVNAKPAAPVVNSSADPTTGEVTGTIRFTDGDGDKLTFTTTAPKKGVISIDENGNFTYTPTAAARKAAAAPGAKSSALVDTVTVTVADGHGGTATVKLNLAVTPALSQSGSGYEASGPTLAIGTVIGRITEVPESEGPTYALTTGPTRGQVKVDAVTGTFTYVPNVDARYAAAKTPGIDTDVFTVTVTDALGLKTAVTVSVEVAPPLTSNMDQRSTTIAVTLQEMYFFNQADTDRTLDLLKEAGVTNIRILVPWMGVELFDDVWTWGAVDRMVNGAAARNIEVLAVLNSPPVWASVPNVPLLTGRPADPAEFAEYAGKVATRYAGKISAYEIWNEPNYMGFWAPAPNAAQYTEILKAAYPVIKAADPNAVVLAGSVASVIDFFNITVSPVRFIKEMYAAGAAGYFDAIAFHPYLYTLKFSKGGSTVNAPLWQAKEIYKLMVANGDGNKKIWATEYGQPSHLVSEESQADYIADFLRTWRNQSWAGPAFIQTIKDNTEADENAANMGLFTKDWTPKKAWATLIEIVQENARLLT